MPLHIDKDRLLDVLDKAYKGPLVKQFDWDTQVIPGTIAAKLEKYGLQGTCDPENPINQDLDLADRFFQAGLEVAEEVGMLNIDTERAIRYSRDELLEGLDLAPQEFTLGEGNQAALFKHRGIGDPTEPIWVSPLSIVVTEDIFGDVVEAIARVPEVDCLEGPSLQTVYGATLRAGSPYELMAGKRQADLFYEAIKRAGREGIGLYAVGTSPTHYGVLGGFGIPGGYRPGYDIVLVLSPVEIKTSLENLFKLVHTYNCDGFTYGGSWSMIGGYAGGPEGSAVSCVACTIMLYNVYQCVNGASFPYDIHTMGNCGRNALWSLSMVFEALARNTHICANSVLNQTAGPATDMILYESAVGMMTLAVTGATSCTGPRTSGGKYTNFITPVETQFAGEVFKKSPTMELAQANSIAKQLIPKYEPMLGKPPKGKSIKECYDLDKMEPTAEWRAIYETVKQECIDLGIALDS
jgi:methylamine--corrinoid protein Co-methyltransferase